MKALAKNKKTNGNYKAFTPSYNRVKDLLSNGFAVGSYFY